MWAVSTFFQAIPDKVCSVCGEKLEEQAESYLNECLSCVHEQVKNHLIHP